MFLKFEGIFKLSDILIGPFTPENNGRYITQILYVIGFRVLLKPIHGHFPQVISP